MRNRCSFKCSKPIESRQGAAIAYNLSKSIAPIQTGLNHHGGELFR
jgi:hypothetical protein